MESKETMPRKESQFYVIIFIDSSFSSSCIFTLRVAIAT